MSIFWLFAGMLLLGALMMLLPPLWRPRMPGAPVTVGGANLAVHRDHLLEAQRDLGSDLIAPEQFAQVRTDIQRRWLDDAAPVAAAAARPARHSAVALALLIPIGSVLSYLALGDRHALAPDRIGGSAGQADARHSVTPEQIQKMAANLAQRLKAEPDNAQGWMMLARSYTTLGRYNDAVIAFRRASELAPGNATLLADFADVLGVVAGKRLAGEPARLIQQALDADPRHVKALALAGSAAFESRDYASAQGYWRRLLALAPADSPIARSALGSIAQAQQLEGAAPVGGVEAGGGVAAGGAVATVAGEVRISPALAQRIAPGDTLFVFARAAQGPRMPLAILRQPVGAWPARFVLDDSLAMTPNLRLSGHARVLVGARISRSGNATPQPGDLTGQAGPLATGAQNLRITIDQVEP
ncbi:MAG: c-type cytochrome biogenesis protein CcmI [Rhizobacter sp.]|nr:c-type cytochrome biogenesis protein CcmI [Rhizobacter sp.]